MATPPITEQDFQEMENVLFEYEPLPHEIETRLEPLYGFDASAELLNRLEEVFSQCCYGPDENYFSNEMKK